MGAHNLFHQLFIRKVNVMENASSKKRVRQLLLRVGGDDHDGALFGLHRALGLVDIKLHLIQLPEQVIGEFQIRLVDLVNQKHHLFL